MAERSVVADSAAPFFPECFPPAWAGAWGEDEFGLWAALEVGGVRQRFRWIVPGRFLMGSPADEPERLSDEEQHEVTLSEGFWLADTACTQALWQAVLGDNPSRFRDDPRQPVERVSWDDAQRLLAELNRRVAALSARLASEAEWEYACRAGTTTPFSFGANIGPEQVNYDGTYPYAGGRKGLFRGKTVVVASLPANAWGLYEMHGNVWEWCADGYGEYASGPQVDPRAALEGALRVLRGGSWSDGGRDVRSAQRAGGVPGGRAGIVGFRLALGPSRPAEPARGER
ncbi:formylglycine-generating enzyme family protein [Accumulibacter sp.]|uniref:formylglycine-generating enzyme family protein n=1 Tax=Accumulibacter sp. TaxID=2053492 RepID=UPI00260BEA5B|nr:formylglycine-generating enzyme family protein [Accumulibacter sp.]